MAARTDCAGVSTPSKDNAAISNHDHDITERLARLLYGIPAIIKHTPTTATPLKITCINGWSSNTRRNSRFAGGNSVSGHRMLTIRADLRSRSVMFAWEHAISSLNRSISSVGRG